MNLRELENTLIVAVKHSRKYENEDPLHLIQDIKSMKKEFKSRDDEESHRNKYADKNFVHRSTVSSFLKKI